MRQKNLKMQIALRFPFDQPDENGVIYSREAVERAISTLHSDIPIKYRDNETEAQGIVIGHTSGYTASVLWSDDCKVCEVVLGASVNYGGTECFVKNIENNVVTDFSITSIGLSR